MAGFVRKGAVCSIVTGEERYGKMSKLELARHRGKYRIFYIECTTHCRIVYGQSQPSIRRLTRVLLVLVLQRT